MESSSLRVKYLFLEKKSFLWQGSKHHRCSLWDCIHSSLLWACQRGSHHGRASVRTLPHRSWWLVRSVAMWRVVPLTDGLHLTTKSEPLYEKAAAFQGFWHVHSKRDQEHLENLEPETCLGHGLYLGKQSANWVTEIALLWSIKSGSST